MQEEDKNFNKNRIVNDNNYVQYNLEIIWR